MTVQPAHYRRLYWPSASSSSPPSGTGTANTSPAHPPSSLTTGQTTGSTGARNGVTAAERATATLATPQRKSTPCAKAQRPLQARTPNAPPVLAKTTGSLTTTSEAHRPIDKTKPLAV